MGEIENVPMSQLAEVNPRSSTVHLAPDSEVTFLGMQDVSEEGRVLQRHRRSLAEVRNGYTCFADGDVLFAKITPCMENGKGAQATGLANGIGFGSTEFHVLRAGATACARYVYWWSMARSLRLQAETFMTGSAGQRRVQASFFYDFQVPALPLPEQRRIAEILDTVDEAIRKTEEVIAKLQQMKQGLLHDLLTRGIDDNGELRDPERHPEEFKDSALGLIPKGWEVEHLASLTNQIIDGAHHTPTYSSSGVPFLRVTDLHAADIDPTRTKRIPEPEHRVLIRRCHPQPGDVLLSKNGTIGIPRVVDWEWPFSIFVSLALIRPKSARIDSRFLELTLSSFVVAQQIHRRSKQLSVTNLHLEEIREFLIPLPVLGEQHRIAAAYGRYCSREDTEIAALTKLRELQTGLMDDLLTGRVRVPLSNPPPE